MKKQISALRVLPEATDYNAPFSRAVQCGNMLFISGTASIGPDGETMHIDNFEAQALRTLGNIRALLDAAGFSWADVVDMKCYLLSMLDYGEFCRIRTGYFALAGLEFPPASTCVQATLCRPDLLVEISVTAMKG